MRTQIHDHPNPVGNNIPIALDERAMQQSRGDPGWPRSGQILGGDLTRRLFRRSSLRRVLFCHCSCFRGFRPGLLDSLNSRLCLSLATVKVRADDIQKKLGWVRVPGDRMADLMEVVFDI